VIDALCRAPREHLDILRRDAGYALRLFRRRPGMTASALLTLAIGIGLTAAVFSVVYGVLWRSLPLPESERMVHISEVGPPPQRAEAAVSPANFVDWRKETRTLQAFATVGLRPASVITDTGAEEVVGAGVSRDFFDVFPVRPVLGRLFDDSDFAPLAAQVAARDAKEPSIQLQPTVVIIGYDMWQRQFGGRPDVVGQQADFGRAGKVEIIGVLGREFRLTLLPVTGAWFPDVPDPDARRARYLMALGRLAPGATVEQSQAEFDVIADRLAAAYPDANKDRGVRVASLRSYVTAGVRTQLWFLFGTAACVLLMACANVSNLLLTHTSGRSRELMTRVALGASRAHLVRQALTEGLVLAVVGAGAGLLLAWWAVPSLVAIAPRSIPRLNEVTVGSAAVVFAAIAALCVGLTCGLAASLPAGRLALGTTLRTAGRAGGQQGSRLRQSLIVAEIALALMLAVAAGLLVQTMRVVSSLPLGYDPSGVLSIGIKPDTRLLRDGAAAKAKLEADLTDAIRSLSGVLAAGVGPRPLLAGMGTAIELPSSPSSSIAMGIDAVGPGYLEALGARLAGGRFFDERDGPGNQPVAIVNQTAEERYWHRGAVGERILHNKQTVVIVGVLVDVRRTGLEVEPEPTLYLPSGQTGMFWANNLLVRASGDPRELLPAIRTVVRQAYPALPLARIETLQGRLDMVTAPRRFTLWLVSLFSIIALGLAVIGIYGVVAESVAQRVPEIGVRMALGASAGGVMQMVLRQGALMIGLGIALGTAAALAMNGVMTSFVFRVPTTDPVSFGIACLTLTLAGLLACAIPARRAARIDPVIALRQE
jgi:predicted permease